MRKIPTIFLRDMEDMKHVTTEPNPACSWVFAGEGFPTRKYDGTCVMLDDAGSWWARREVKPGKTPPPNYVPVETDPATGKTMGWEPIGQSAFAKYHAEAVTSMSPYPNWSPGTYELIGPKIQGNPEAAEYHKLITHMGAMHLAPIERTYEEIRARTLRLHESGVEGIVFHHPDGRMAKIKGRDFPQARKVAA